MGHSIFALKLCEGIINSGSEVVMVVSLDDFDMPENSYNFRDFCRDNNISLHLTDDINKKNTEQVIRSKNPDFLVSAWSKILDYNILNIPKYFTIGTHPTRLPFNKGRHPIHWSIVLGFKFNYLSFFRMNSNIDAGEILLQKKYYLNNMSIKLVMKKLEVIAYDGMKELASILKKDVSLKGKKNDKSIHNFWRMRNIHDVTLDPRMSAEIFIKTVKSFSPPYSGAILLFNRNNYFIIKNSRELKKTFRPKRWENREYGYIFKINHKYMILKVSDSVLMLTYNMKSDSNQFILEGQKLMPPSFYYDNRNK